MRQLLQLIVMLAIVGKTSIVLSADADYPSKPIRVIVPTVAGGTLDLYTRALMQAVSPLLGQSIVVENKPGASLLIGTQLVAKSPPDGYTLLAMSNTFVTAPSLIKDTGYDPVKDFVGVGLMNDVPLVILVSADSPYKTLNDLVAVAKASPDKISYGSAGSGSSSHFAAASFFLQMGSKILHVPYKGNAPALLDVMGGRVTMVIDAVSVAAQHVKSGKLRALAVTSSQRSPMFPDVPTIAESGFPGYALTAFAGIAAPVGTPRVAIDRFHAAMARAMSNDLRERFLKDGVELRASQSPQFFNDFIAQETSRYMRVIKDAGISVD